MRLLVLIFLIVTSPVYAQDEQPVQELEYIPVIPDFDIPRADPIEPAPLNIPVFNIPTPGEIEQRAQQKPRELRQIHIDTWQNARNEVLSILDEFENLLPAPPTEKNMQFVMANVDGDELQKILDRKYFKTCHDFHKRPNITCLSSFDFPYRYDIHGGNRELQALSSQYSLEEYAPGDHIPFNGSWAGTAGDLISFRFKEELDLENNPNAGHIILLKKEYEESLERYTNALRTLRDLVKPKSSYGLFSKAAIYQEDVETDMEAFSERTLPFYKTYFSFQKMMVGGFDGAYPHPNEVLTQMKSDPNARAVEISHQFKGPQYECNFIYSEAYFNGYTLIASAQYDQNNCILSHVNDNLKDAYRDATFWLVCENATEEDMMQYYLDRSRGWGSLSCEYYHRRLFSYVAKSNDGGDFHEEHVELTPYIDTRDTFFVYKLGEEQPEQFLNASASGANDDDLP